MHIIIQVKKTIHLVTGLIHMRLLIERYTAKTQRHQPQRSPLLQSVLPMDQLCIYATVGKSKKKGPKETGDVVMFTHKEDQYAMPNKKEDGEAVVKSGGRVEAWRKRDSIYDDTVG